jgi:EAL domain-containing protein (putative c-di-GMP-specific phosphodiesterase class I)
LLLENRSGSETPVPELELIDYFNDRFNQSGVTSLPDEPLRLRGDRVSGRFGRFRLDSLFQPVVAPETLRVVSHEARTQVRDAYGQTYCLATVFNTVDHPHAYVHIDRLCRIVHMLNYLIKSEKYGTLLLPVDKRHVLSVRGDHGRYFEQVLHRCGLSPEQIVISLPDPLVDSEETPHVCNALKSYRHHGYQIAVTVELGPTAFGCLQRALALKPEVLRVTGAASRLLNKSGEAIQRYRHLGHLCGENRTAWLRDSISTDEDYIAARDAGFDLLQGIYFGSPSPEIRWAASPVPPQAAVGLCGEAPISQARFAC